MKKCPKLDENPVVTDWQMKIVCPDCKHYCNGQCNNPKRKEDEPCPLDIKMKEVEDAHKHE